MNKEILFLNFYFLAEHSRIAEHLVDDGGHALLIALMMLLVVEDGPLDEVALSSPSVHALLSSTYSGSVV